MKTIIEARHKDWHVVERGESLESIARYLSCEGTDLEILSTKTEEQVELEKLPPELRSVFSYNAYERGHSAGEDECLAILKEMIYDFLPSIKAFEQRVRAEYRGK